MKNSQKQAIPTPGQVELEIAALENLIEACRQLTRARELKPFDSTRFLVAAERVTSAFEAFSVCGRPYKEPREKKH